MKIKECRELKRVAHEFGAGKKSETANRGTRRRSRAALWIGTGEFGGWVALIQLRLFEGGDAQLATDLETMALMLSH